MPTSTPTDAGTIEAATAETRVDFRYWPQGLFHRLSTCGAETPEVLGAALQRLVLAEIFGVSQQRRLGRSL